MIRKILFSVNAAEFVVKIQWNFSIISTRMSMEVTLPRGSIFWLKMCHEGVVGLRLGINALGGLGRGHSFIFSVSLFL